LAKQIRFCKGNDMFIVNGPIGDDKLTGKVTCRNASTVDYCISSWELLKYFSNFGVLDFCKLFSDVHCPLKVSLTRSTCNFIINKNEPKNQTVNNFQCGEKINKNGRTKNV
jgi:hypothetical protein